MAGTIRDRGYKFIWAKKAFVKHIGASTAKKEKTSKILEKQGEVAYIKFMKGLDDVKGKRSRKEQHKWM
jgi:hypothetical protein